MRVLMLHLRSPLMLSKAVQFQHDRIPLLYKQARLYRLAMLWTGPPV